MKILVVSDTHGYNTNLFKLLEKEKPIDMLIHCGDSGDLSDYIEEFIDCPVVMVRGNCDGMSKLPAAALIALGGHKVFITHGHIYGARPSVPLMTDIAKENGADIVMYGHTHVPYLKKVFGVTVLNPGSISLPRQEDGKKSYAIMTVADDESVDFEICYHKE